MPLICGARAIVLLHPGDDLDAALFRLGGDLLHGVGQVEVARAQALRLHVDVAVVLRMGGGEVAGGIGGPVEAGPRGLERIAVEHERVDAGARLHVVEEPGDAVVHQVSHLGLKPDHRFRRGRAGTRAAAALAAGSKPRPAVTAVAASEAAFTKSLREIALLSSVLDVVICGSKSPMPRRGGRCATIGSRSQALGPPPSRLRRQTRNRARTYSSGKRRTSGRG